MLDVRPRMILVAVESTDGDAALRYAAQEARQRRCGVHVIHVLPPTLGGSGQVDSVVLTDGELRLRGREVLRTAAGRLEVLLRHDELAVSTELCHGAVVPTLIHESSAASLVVVQHRGMGPGEHSPVLSVTTGVAARSHAPLVAVPAGWQQPDPERELVVTVGVGDDRENDNLVDMAAAEALRMGALLRIVHAGDRLSLHDLVTDFPDIPFKYVNSMDEPVDALLACAPDTTLFVVGRRHPRLPLGQHLGPVVRTLLRLSPVPVMVMDPGRDDEAEGGRDLATSVVP
jgi:nucleotide-binding universal stress UspA family protein